MYTDNDRITRIFGINNEVEYVFNDYMKNGKFTKKPSYSTVKKFLNHEEICSFKGEPVYNDNFVYTFDLYSPYNGYREISINEDKTINIIRKVFRADLNEIHLFSDYIVYENELNSKGDVEYEVDNLIREFNKAMIESNEKMLRYAKLHKLILEDTDCEELFKLVYPDMEYKIVDGKMECLSRDLYVTWHDTCCTGYDMDTSIGSINNNGCCGVTSNV